VFTVSRTPSQRSTESRRRRISGGAKLVQVALETKAREALDGLRAAGYAPTITGCVAKAVIETAERELGSF
jgi:hypothetical protein